jgi:hypothetical protein
LPVSTVVPLPICTNAPVPEMTLPKVNVSARLIAKMALSTTLPASEPEVPPLPSTSAPALMVVVPP